MVSLNLNKCVKCSTFLNTKECIHIIFLLTVRTSSCKVFVCLFICNWNLKDYNTTFRGFSCTTIGTCTTSSEPLFKARQQDVPWEPHTWTVHFSHGYAQVHTHTHRHTCFLSHTSKCDNWICAPPETELHREYKCHYCGSFHLHEWCGKFVL